MQTKLFVKKVPMEFNKDSKTATRTQVRQRVLEIYYFFNRNPNLLLISSFVPLNIKNFM
jgi:hypothetical protein